MGGPVDMNSDCSFLIWLEFQSEIKTGGKKGNALVFEAKIS